MQEFPEEEVEETVTDPSAAVEFGLSRRDLIKAATLLTGSMVLMLSRCRPLEEMGTDLPPVPADFKRFVLAEQSPFAPAEKLIVALGSQCPDLNCVLWWAEDQEFRFFASIEQIINRYVRAGRAELFWLD